MGWWGMAALVTPSLAARGTWAIRWASAQRHRHMSTCERRAENCLQGADAAYTTALFFSCLPPLLLCTSSLLYICMYICMLPDCP